MNENKKQEKLIVALDTADLAQLELLQKELVGVVTYYKVGLELFTAYGWQAVKLIQNAGGKVFLDLKLHDIPNTVAKTAAVIAEHQVDMFNVHALGGFEMMSWVRKAVDEKVPAGQKKPVVLAVTILTSHSQEELSSDLGIQRKVQDQVLHLAKLAQKAGLDGVVCSPHEIEILRKEMGPDFIIVTPGIRSAENAMADQKRTLTAREAIQLGANHIVVGRPITAAKNPREEASKILQTL